MPPGPRWLTPQPSRMHLPVRYFPLPIAGRSKWATKSFIPSGTFYPGGESKNPPDSTAIFGAVVQSSCVRTNPLTNKQFVHLEVETLGGCMDVVVHPSLVNDHIPVGAVIRGNFWLSGCVPMPPDTPVLSASPSQSTVH